MLGRSSMVRMVAGVGLVAAVGLGAGGCQKNTTTGRSQLIMLSWQEEVQLGTEAQPQLVQEFGGEVAREDLRQYVQEVGMRLVATTSQDDPELAKLPWEFTLLDSDVVNAFALPGGKVFMSRGLAQMMTNEAQLAGVLGHEIGHVTARHTNERFSRAAGAQLGVGILGAVLGTGADAQVLTDLAGQATQLAVMSYDRRQELESDALGMRYMSRAGYDPAAQKGVMEILLKASGGAAPPEFFSTHPHPETRIRRIEELLATEYAGTQNNPQFRTGEREFRDRFLSKLAIAYPSRGTPRFDAEAAFEEQRYAMKQAGLDPATAESCDHHGH
jgi:predicted Zn-dependent protease